MNGVSSVQIARLSNQESHHAVSLCRSAAAEFRRLDLLYDSEKKVRTMMTVGGT